MFATSPVAARSFAVQDRLVEAKRLIDAGKNETALKDLAKYTRDFPTSFEGWVLYGRALHGVGRFDEALDAHCRASQFPGAMALAAFHAARDCDRLGNLDEAFVWLDQAIDAGYSDWPVLAADLSLENCRKDPRFARCIPFSLDPKKPFVEDVVVLHDVQGELHDSRFGWSVAEIGDVDADGCIDFAVGAPFHSDPERERGKVYVYSGRNGREILTLGASEDEQMGWAVGAAGDVNKDGKFDLWAAAPGVNGHTGALYVISGVDGAQLKRLPGQGTNDRFAESVWPLGDVDGDGVVELLVAAPGNDAAGDDCGRIYVVSLVDGSVFATFEGVRALDRLGAGGVCGWMQGDELRIAASAGKSGEDRKGATYVWRALDDDAPLVLEGDADARSRGGRIAFVADLDGDGRPELLASDEIDPEPSLAAASLWAWSSQSNERLWSLHSPMSGDAFGRSFSSFADLDGDGRAEVAIGAWRSRRGGPYCGGVMIHSSKNGERIARATGALARIGAGFSVARLADINGDKVPELLVGAPNDPARGPNTGRAFVISGASFKGQLQQR